MAQEEYEVIPHKLLHDLSYDVEALKKKLSAPDAKINELILEIESMKDVIHELNTIFAKALGESKSDSPSKLLTDLTQKVDMVITQNETIAKGMLAISDKVDEWMQKQAGFPRPAQQHPASVPPVSHNMGAPNPLAATPARMAPPPSSFPPPPPNIKKKGLF